MASLSDLAKKIKQFRQAIPKAAALAASEVVLDLQRVGPWWTGDFARSWEIRAGDVNIPNDYQGRPWQESGPPPRTQRELPPQLDPPQLPRLADGVLYTIGNRIDYRMEAMDYIPILEIDKYRYELPGQTSPLGARWFDTYCQGGHLQRTVDITIDSILERAWR